MSAPLSVGNLSFDTNELELGGRTIKVNQAESRPPRAQKSTGGRW